MRNNQRLTKEQLWQEARDALEKAKKSQLDMAKALGVSEATISRALREPSTRYADVLGRIIEHVLGFRVEREEPTWRAHKID